MTTASPIFPQTPHIGIADLTALTACTTRAPVATAGLAAANIIELVGTSVDGIRIDKIRLKGASSSFVSATVPMTVSIWIWDGTKAYIFDEIKITAKTPSTTEDSFSIEQLYSSFNLPATYKLYVSVSVTTVANTTALVAEAFGGKY